MAVDTNNLQPVPGASIRVSFFFNDNVTKAPSLFSNPFFNFYNMCSSKASLRFFNSTTSKQYVHCKCLHHHVEYGSVI